jgi:hypothetical protein
MKKLQNLLSIFVGNFPQKKQLPTVVEKGTSTKISKNRFRTTHQWC